MPKKSVVEPTAIEETNNIQAVEPAPEPEEMVDVSPVAVDPVEIALSVRPAENGLPAFPL